MGTSKYFQIRLKLPVPHATILQGLEQWFGLGLISNLKWRDLPNDELRRDITLTIYGDKETELFVGITAWLELGLLDEEQVRNISRNHLSSMIPDYVAVGYKPAIDKEVTLEKLEPKLIPLVESISKSSSSNRLVPVPRMLQALFLEFSTLWLLFLGVFLTVVSSGLLAASQWQNFSSVGQYLILFAYTLGFLGVSFTTAKSDRLELTTKTLKLVTLLLVPANFWAIDGLGLLSQPLGLILGAIAGLTLSGLTIFLLNFKKPLKQLELLTAIAILLLSWLHLGWGISTPFKYPPVAVYFGIGGIAAVTYLGFRNNSNRAELPSNSLFIKIAGGYGALVLVTRALFFNNVSVFELGLALGICGWALCQFEFKNPQPQEQSALEFQTKLGQILLAVGWFTAVWDPYPLQALSVSCLIAWLLSDRLRILERPKDLTNLFFWGLQMLWLCSRLIPKEWVGTEILIKIFQTDAIAAIIGVGLLPYLVLTLGISKVYRVRQHHSLAGRGENLALGLGVFLSILSFAYPFTRLINLSVSAIILGFIQSQRSPTSKDLKFLIYTTHIFSLGAISSFIAFAFPRITSVAWPWILLGAMLAEWMVTWWLDEKMARSNSQNSLNKQPLIKEQIWRHSSWQLGLGIGCLCYFWIILSNAGTGMELGWAIAPITLSFLGTRKSFMDRAGASNLSIVSILMWQFLAWPTDSSHILSLAVGLAVMLVNTHCLDNLLSAAITTGFSLMLIAATLWQITSNNLAFSINGVVLSIVLMFAASRWLKSRQAHNSLINVGIYTQALGLWAIFISIATLCLQTYLAIIVFSGSNGRWIPAEFFVNLLLNLSFGTFLITAGLIYRTWQQPLAKAVWGIAWGVELLAAAAIAYANGTLLELAIANLALGLSTQLLGDLWIRRSGQSYALSWHLIPLVYSLIGLFLRIGIFNNVSGLLTLGASLVGIGIGRRVDATSFKALIYVGMIGITSSGYELLFYQMSQSQGGSLADGLVVLGVLGGAIAYIYQLFAGGIMTYLKLSRPGVNAFAHLHWVLSVILLMAGVALSPLALSFNTSIAIGLAIVLSIYALFQGRSSDRWGELWVYVGITLTIGTVIYQLAYVNPNLWLIQTILIPYSAAIASIVGAIFFMLPWQVWGWSQRPWHRAAFCLPILFSLIHATAISTPSLLIVASFYALIAHHTQNIRLTYLTICFLDWACFRVIGGYSYHIFTFAFILCFSVLYVTQMEPNLRTPNSREIRHNLRCFACASLCAIAFFYSFNSIGMALFTWGLSFGFAIAGLLLRVRAYLFVGTLTFMLLVLNQAVLLVSQYGFLLWAIGIVAGIGFITIAANFEVRRDRILAIARNILHELEAWA